MSAGSVAISQPILVDPSAQLNAESALASLRGTHRRGDSRSIGLYWETYGVQPDDSATHLVWVERVTPQGLVRELGIALRMATDRNAPVAVRWEEQRAPRESSVLEGRVPVIGRTLQLDVGSLERGEYRVGVAVSSRGQGPVRSFVAFQVE
jgi:hypothetical protein